jgi:hypothetical protein
MSGLAIQDTARGIPSRKDVDLEFGVPRGEKRGLSFDGFEGWRAESDFEEQRSDEGGGYGHKYYDAVDFRADHGKAQADLGHDHPHFTAGHHAQADLQYVLPAERKCSEAAADEFGYDGGGQNKLAEKES